MTGGQDDAANLIHTSDGMMWDDVTAMKAEIGKLRLCRELLDAAVDAWESCDIVMWGSPDIGRRPWLTDEWHAKAKEALGER